MTISMANMISIPMRTRRPHLLGIPMMARNIVTRMWFPLGADVPFVAPDLPIAETISSEILVNLLPASDQFPDGPCFALIKPPQLG